jgi:putative ABC transport system permease protein
MILGESLKVTLVGIGAGLLLAIGLGQILAGFLYDVRRADPLVLGAASVLLALVALCACFVPARRAALVDPIDRPAIRIKCTPDHKSSPTCGNMQFPWSVS